mgnify:CR=1 FL=1
MHPAGSIIIFTTLSGLGFGLITLLSLGALAPGGGAIFWASALALALSAAGLTASLGHLGRIYRMQGNLEQANVEVVTEISDLIAAQRAYEMNAKVITAADQMLSATSNLMR